MNHHVPLVSLIGRAGSGKTLMAIMAGLEQGPRAREGTLQSHHYFETNSNTWKRHSVICLEQWKKRWLLG